MFEASLVNDTARTARPYAVSFSLLLQVAVAAGAVAYPLLHIEALPAVKLRAPSPFQNAIELVDPKPAEEQQVSQQRPSVTPVRPVFRIPERRLAPDATASLSRPVIGDDMPAFTDQSGPSGPFVPGGIPGSGGGPIKVDAPARPNPSLERPKVVAPPTAPVPVGGKVRQPQLIREIKPSYPALAVQTRTQGTVRIEAIISRDGIVRDAHAVSGHPLLVAAALDAVRQWRYRPTILNDQPVEVALVLEVNFTLAR